MQVQDIVQLKNSAIEASNLLRIVSNPNRLLLLCQLINSSKCVSELEQITGINQPTLSQQLGILRKSKIVSTQKIGKQIFYHLKDDKTLKIMETLYECFCTQQK